MSTEEVQDIKYMIDCCLIELHDDYFDIKVNNYHNIFEITIKSNTKFKISSIQPRVLTLIDYVKSCNQTIINYQADNSKIFKAYPLFYYNNIKKFKITIKII